MNITDFIETDSEISYRDLQPLSFYRQYNLTENLKGVFSLLQKIESEFANMVAQTLIYLQGEKNA